MRIQNGREVQYRHERKARLSTRVDVSSDSFERPRLCAYRCTVKLSLYKYKGKGGTEIYFQYVRVRPIP